MAAKTTHFKVSNDDVPDGAKQFKNRLSRDDERNHEDSQS